MLSETVGSQLFALLVFGGFGAIVGLCSDLLAWLTPRRVPRWVREVRDAVFVLLVAVGFFLLSLPLLAGRPRPYGAAGILLGAALYRAILHRPLLIAVRWLTRPLRRIYSAVGRFCGRLWSPTKARLRRSVSRLRARRLAKRPARSKKVKKIRGFVTLFFKKLLQSFPNVLYNGHK